MVAKSPPSHREPGPWSLRMNLNSLSCAHWGQGRGQCYIILSTRWDASVIPIWLRPGRLQVSCWSLFHDENLETLVLLTVKEPRTSGQITFAARGKGKQSKDKMRPLSTHSFSLCCYLTVLPWVGGPSCVNQGNQDVLQGKPPTQVSLSCGS